MPRPPRKPVLKRKQPSVARMAQSQSDPRQKKAQRLGEMIAVNNQYAALADSPFVQDTLGWTKGFYNRDVSGNMAAYSPSEDDIYVSRSTTPEPDTASTVPLASRKTARSAITHEIGHAQDFQSRKQNREAFPEYAKVARPTFTAVHPERFDFSLEQPLPPVTVMQNPDGDARFAERYDTQKGTVSRVPSRGIRSLLGILGRQEQPMTQSEQQAFANLDRYYAFGGKKRNNQGQVVLTTDPQESLAQAYTNAVDFLSRTGADTSEYRKMIGQYEGNTPGAGAIVQDLLRSRPVYQKHPLKGVIR